jgi:hypothetical protein
MAGEDDDHETQRQTPIPVSELAAAKESSCIIEGNCIKYLPVSHDELKLVAQHTARLVDRLRCTHRRATSISASEQFAVDSFNSPGLQGG